MPATLSLDKEKKLILEHFQAFLAETRQMCNNVPLKKRDFPLYLKLKQELKESELPDFEEIERIFLKTQEREKKFKSKWQKEEVDLFIFLVFYLSKKTGLAPEHFEREHWQLISRNFLERNWKQCWLKWRNLLRFNPLSKKWSKEEDSHLVEIINSYEMQRRPFKWTRIADELFERGSARLLRLGKHCRERWNNHLNPTLNKGEWTDEEDIELISHILKLGKKWSQISRKMAGRNEYSVKNRYYYLMKINKFETLQVSDAELRKIVEKKQEAIEAKRQKSLRLQSMNTVTQQTPENINAFAMPNQMNALTFQNFMVNYQSFLQFQSFFLYRKNLENMYANMQKLTGTPVAMPGAGFIKMEEELTKPRETAGSIFKVEDHHKV